MIRRFSHRGLERFFIRSDHRGIPAQHMQRLTRMLDRLEAATRPQDMDLPGFRFHPLKSKRRGTFAVSVSANWRLTFDFDGPDAIHLNLEDYH